MAEDSPSKPITISFFKMPTPNLPWNRPRMLSWRQPAIPAHTLLSPCIASDEDSGGVFEGLRNRGPRFVFAKCFMAILYRSYSRVRSRRIPNCCFLNCAFALLFSCTEGIRSWKHPNCFCWPALSHPNRHQLLRRFPELPVDEIGSEAPHQCELFGLPRPDLQGARLEGRKGLLH